MATLLAFIRQHPAASYFVSTFVISWGCLLAVVGPRGIPGAPERFDEMLPGVIAAVLAGPSVSGLLLTGLVHGRAGLGELRSRLFRWRVHVRWYAAAFLLAPFVYVSVPLALSPFFPGFLPGVFATPNLPMLLLVGAVAGISAGVFEELGWTGFAIPELRSRYGRVATGLTVGILWAVWHIPVNFWSSGGPSGELSLPPLLTSLIFSAGILTAYRVLIVWVYDRCGSLFVAMVMHASLTSGNVIFVPLAMTGATGPLWALMVAAAFWVVVAVVVLASGGRRARRMTPAPVA